MIVKINVSSSDNMERMQRLFNVWEKEMEERYTSNDYRDLYFPLEDAPVLSETWNYYESSKLLIENIIDHNESPIINDGETSKKKDNPDGQRSDASSKHDCEHIDEMLSTYSMLNTPILILGKSGSGKAHLAERIHFYSMRTGNFRSLNVSGMTPQLLRGELFGYAKGAYTDAKTDSSGIVGDVIGGTLFLDEIGDALPECRPMLLKFIAEKCVEPIGKKSYVADVRIIAATNKDEDEFKKDRTDLLYRFHPIIKLSPVILQIKHESEMLDAIFYDCRKDFPNKDEVGRFEYIDKNSPNTTTLKGVLKLLCDIRDNIDNIFELEGVTKFLESEITRRKNYAEKHKIINHDKNINETLFPELTACRAVLTQFDRLKKSGDKAYVKKKDMLPALNSAIPVISRACRPRKVNLNAIKKTTVRLE